MATLFDIAASMKEIEEELPFALSNAAVDVAVAVINDLVICTPADTGAALSNWQVTLDEPATEEIPAYSPSPRGIWRGHIWNHTVDPDQTRAANAPLVIDNAALTLADKQPGQDIYITNIVGTDKEPESYILELDAGRSPQFIGDFMGREAIVAEGAAATISVVIP